MALKERAGGGGQPLPCGNKMICTSNPHCKHCDDMARILLQQAQMALFGVGGGRHLTNNKEKETGDERLRKLLKDYENP